MKLIETVKAQCSTCPFRKDGWTELAPLLTDRALNEGTPICHSTGPRALVPKGKRVSRKALACRGARLIQVKVFFALGFLDAPTVEAWGQKALELGCVK